MPSRACQRTECGVGGTTSEVGLRPARTPRVHERQQTKGYARISARVRFGNLNQGRIAGLAIVYGRLLASCSMYSLDIASDIVWEGGLASPVISAWHAALTRPINQSNRTEMYLDVHKGKLLTGL